MYILLHIWYIIMYVYIYYTFYTSNAVRMNHFACHMEPPFRAIDIYPILANHKPPQPRLTSAPQTWSKFPRVSGSPFNSSLATWMGARLGTHVVWLWLGDISSGKKKHGLHDFLEPVLWGSQRAEEVAEDWETENIQEIQWEQWICQAPTMRIGSYGQLETFVFLLFFGGMPTIFWVIIHQVVSRLRHLVPSLYTNPGWIRTITWVAICLLHMSRISGIWSLEVGSGSSGRSFQHVSTSSYINWSNICTEFRPQKHSHIFHTTSAVGELDPTTKSPPKKSAHFQRDHPRGGPVAPQINT